MVKINHPCNLLYGVFAEFQRRQFLGMALIKRGIPTLRTLPHPDPQRTIVRLHVTKSKKNVLYFEGRVILYK